MLVARLRQIDADVFVGHNFAAFDLDVLLHRLQHHKVRRGRVCSWFGLAGCWLAAEGGVAMLVMGFLCWCTDVLCWQRRTDAHHLHAACPGSAGAQLEQPGPPEAQPLPQPGRRRPAVWRRRRRWCPVRCACLLLFLLTSPAAAAAAAAAAALSAYCAWATRCSVFLRFSTRTLTLSPPTLHACLPCDAVVAGRLLCDTYLAARDLVHEVEYTLSTLARNLLKQERAELNPADIPGGLEWWSRGMMVGLAVGEGCWGDG